MKFYLFLSAFWELIGGRDLDKVRAEALTYSLEGVSHARSIK